MNVKLRRELALLVSLAAAPALFRPRPRDVRPSPWAMAAGISALALAFWPSRKFTFADRSVVITGGSRGLGLVMARQLVMEGAKVTLIARDPEELERAKQQLCTISQKVFTVVCDVSDPVHLDNAFAEARARFGAIDVLINNAGVVSVGPLNATDDSDFKSQLDVHLGAPLHATRLIRPYFHMQGEGRIINIVSIGGKVPIPHMAAYCASKFALGGFSEASHAELSMERIWVTTAYPGLMRTGSPIQGVFKGDHEKEFAWFALGDNTPGLSISAETAAHRILDASRERRAEVVVSMPAKLGAIVHELLPETFAATLTLAARFMPTGLSRERKTGAASQGLFSRLGWTRPIEALERNLAKRNNQASKFDADGNLGIKTGPGTDEPRPVGTY